MKPLEELLEIAKSAKEKSYAIGSYATTHKLVPELADAVIDLITQLKDAQDKIKYLNERVEQQGAELADAHIENADQFIKISHLEQRLAECETVVKFYGDEKTYLPFDQGHKHNGGKKARDYLTKWSVK